MPRHNSSCYSRIVNRPVKILHSDDFLVVVDKAPGFLCIPDRYDPDAPVIISRLEKEFGRLFVAHRIDRDTSGLIVYARDAETHRHLNAQFGTREVEKTYLAIVRGSPEDGEWRCDLPLRADGDRMHRTLIDARRGKEALTVFRVAERLGDYTLVSAHPETGRTHQIRVHAAASGYPIAADPLYGDGKPVFLSRIKRKWKGDAFDERPLMARTALHAWKLAFVHPGTKEKVSFEAELPRDFKALLAQLRKQEAR